MQIRVRATHEVMYRPERGTVHIVLSLEGPDKAAVSSGVVDVVGRLVAKVRGLHSPDSGPITWFSQSQISNRAQRPWNKDGVQLPMVYTSTADMKVKFSDLDLILPFIEQVTTWKGVSVRGVDWALTEIKKTRVVDEAQRGAVAAALTKAQRYADAAGHGPVRFIQLADVGLLDVAGSGGERSDYLASSARGSGGSEQRTFAPEDVKISCRVEAEFAADSPSEGV